MLMSKNHRKKFIRYRLNYYLEKPLSPQIRQRMYICTLDADLGKQNEAGSSS
jgi:hypothetical protein